MKMKAYAVFLHKPVPLQLLELLKDFLKRPESLPFLACSEVQPAGAFLECHLIKNKILPNALLIESSKRPPRFTRTRFCKRSMLLA